LRLKEVKEEMYYGLDLHIVLTEEESKPIKRGRPTKTPRTSGEFTGAVESLPTPSSQTSHEQVHTPQLKSQGLPQPIAATPTQNSPPPKSTPKANIKALPTVRDHTTDQLTPEGDEYTLREWDEAGEKKVNELGYPQGGRQYRIKTFTLNGRGDKLFMLATECARVLTYRDSYLLFNKNRSLYKIIASQKEKEDLIAQDILPYSYRSRQIAIVTARSMYRQFGSRVIENGRRVRDDYWEAKAKKQGFTEADAAGEKRPGAGKAREAAAQSQVGPRPVFAPGNVVYSNGPDFGAMQPPALHPGIASTMAPLPMITSHDSRYRDIARPRHDLSGSAYSDITRSSSETEIMGQAAHGADFSKALNQQRNLRKAMFDEYWTKPREPPVSTPQSQPAEPATGQAFDTSPQFPSDSLSSSQQNILPQQTSQQSMNPPSYPHPQNPMQSPLRQSSIQPSSSYVRDHASIQYPSQHQQLQQQPHLSRSSSNLSASHGPQAQPYQGQNFPSHHMNPAQHQPQQAMWGAPPPQPQLQQTHQGQSPALHRMPTPGYSPSIGHAGSPVHGQSQSPHSQQQQPGMMGQMYGLGQGLQAYANMNLGMAQRGMYGQGPGQFIQQPGAQQGGAQQWPGVTQGSGGGYQAFQ
jgi:Chromatin remodelling complex Rsc7/Swp82 subunit